MKRNKSGSVAAQLARKKEYREKSGPVGIPGKPNKTNRVWRRTMKKLAEAQ